MFDLKFLRLVLVNLLLVNATESKQSYKIVCYFTNWARSRLLIIYNFKYYLKFMKSYLLN